jgi:WXG100 family type VII secretion target
MTGTLKVTPQELKNTASSFKSTGDQVKKLTQQMTDLVNSLTGSVWSGDAASAYTKKFKGLQNDITRMQKMINEHVTDLNAMAAEYDKTEKANQALANALAADVIV